MPPVGASRALAGGGEHKLSFRATGLFTRSPRRLKPGRKRCALARERDSGAERAATDRQLRLLLSRASHTPNHIRQRSAIDPAASPAEWFTRRAASWRLTTHGRHCLHRVLSFASSHDARNFNDRKFMQFAWQRHVLHL